MSDWRFFFYQEVRDEVGFEEEEEREREMEKQNLHLNWLLFPVAMRVSFM